ncbi:Metallophosphoesterase domain protein [Candidatus Omnitrophus magneticus]|uniref:Metallophosphoesterase domain protein n=1 Tax=Candidatus Omnitrophus magneticus TaxID=1609969 RepID=A0A0F0CRG0_9BACT|nr:Metallophosphoesterase domain protein [Candidatus Omnitrophus magneticus]
MKISSAETNIIDNNIFPLSKNINNKTAASIYTIPSNIGIIHSSSLNSTSRKTLIHIEDAHCNFSAQKSIFKIIDYMEKTYGINRVNLEGGTGKYDISLFTKIENEDIREKIASHLVSKGELNGAEWYSVLNPEKILLWGVENIELYENNLKAYRDFIFFSEKALDYTSKIEKIILEIKEKVYPEKLKNILRVKASYTEGKIKISEYAEFIINESKKYRCKNIYKYKNLQLLLNASEKEKTINFTDASKEREIFLAEIEKELSKNERIELYSVAENFKTGNITNTEFYEYLINKGVSLRVNLKKYKELLKYSEYISTFEKINRARVNKELCLAEQELEENFYNSRVIPRLGKLEKGVRAANNIFKFTIKADEYEWYIENQKLFSSKAIANILAGIGVNEAINSEWDILLNKAKRFYEISKKRDKMFIQNLKWVNGPRGEKVALIIAGGFHGNNLKKLLEKNNINYISIIPEPEKLDIVNSSLDLNSNKKYFKILSGKSESEFNILKNILSPQSMLQVASKINALGKIIFSREELNTFHNAIMSLLIIHLGNKLTVTSENKEEKFSLGKGDNLTLEIKNLQAIKDSFYGSVQHYAPRRIPDPQKLAALKYPGTQIHPYTRDDVLEIMNTAKTKFRDTDAFIQLKKKKAEEMLAVMAKLPSSKNKIKTPVTIGKLSILLSDLGNDAEALSFYGKKHKELVIIINNKNKRSDVYFKKNDNLAYLITHEYLESVLGLKHTQVVRIETEYNNGSPLTPLSEILINHMTVEQLKNICPIHENDPNSMFYNKTLEELNKRAASTIITTVDTISSGLWTKKKIDNLDGIPISSLNTNDKVFPIPDVHGNLECLRDYLEGAGIIKKAINPDEDIFICENITIIQLGDFVDRGNDSLATHKYLRLMQKNARENVSKHIEFIRLIGNHELAYLFTRAKGELYKKRLSGGLQSFMLDEILNGNFIDELIEDIKNGNILACYEKGGKIFSHGLITEKLAEKIEEDATLKFSILGKILKKYKPFSSSVFVKTANKILKEAVIKNDYSHMLFNIGHGIDNKNMGLFTGYITFFDNYGPLYMDFEQVVGHDPHGKKIKTVLDGKIIGIDVYLTGGIKKAIMFEKKAVYYLEPKQPKEIFDSARDAIINWLEENEKMPGKQSLISASKDIKQYVKMDIKNLWKTWCETDKESLRDAYFLIDEFRFLLEEDEKKLKALLVQALLKYFYGLTSGDKVTLTSLRGTTRKVQYMGIGQSGIIIKDGENFASYKLDMLENIDTGWEEKNISLIENLEDSRINKDMEYQFQDIITNFRRGSRLSLVGKIENLTSKMEEAFRTGKYYIMKLKNGKNRFLLLTFSLAKVISETSWEYLGLTKEPSQDEKELTFNAFNSWCKEECGFPKGDINTAKKIFLKQINLPFRIKLNNVETAGEIYYITELLKILPESLLKRGAIKNINFNADNDDSDKFTLYNHTDKEISIIEKYIKFDRYILTASLLHSAGHAFYSVLKNNELERLSNLYREFITKKAIFCTNFLGDPANIRALYLNTVSDPSEFFAENFMHFILLGREGIVDAAPKEYKALRKELFNFYAELAGNTEIIIDKDGKIKLAHTSDIIIANNLYKKEVTKKTSNFSAAKKLIQLIRPSEYATIVMLPVSKEALLFDGTKYTFVKNDIKRKLQTKYGMNTTIIYYKDFRDLILLQKEFLLARDRISKIKGANNPLTRIIAYTTFSNTWSKKIIQDVFSDFIEDTRFAGILSGNFRINDSANKFLITNTVLLGIGLAEWHRRNILNKAEDIKTLEQTIIELLLDITEDNKILNEEEPAILIKKILLSELPLKLKKINFAEKRDAFLAERMLTESL